MKRSFWITQLTSVSAYVVVIFALNARNTKLAMRLAADSNPSEVTTLREAVGPSTSDPVMRQDRIEFAAEAVVGLISTLPPESDNYDYAQEKLVHSEFRKMIPDLLRSVDGLSIDELLMVTRSRSATSPARKFLVMLAAEQDPGRVLRDQVLMGGISKLEVLEVMARMDPAAALRRLPPMNPEKIAHGNTKLRARIRYGIQLLGGNFEQGMAALQEVHEAKNGLPVEAMGSFGIPIVSESSIPALIEAMNRPEYAPMREDLRGLTVKSTLVIDGVDEVTRQVTAMNLSPGELNRTVEDLIKMDVMASEPEPMLAWLAEAQPRSLPGALIKWADRDLDGATGWLNDQEPSPLRDQAISQFALKASKLDQTSAALWVDEIQDETLRNQTRQRVEAN